MIKSNVNEIIPNFFALKTRTKTLATQTKNIRYTTAIFFLLALCSTLPSRSQVKNEPLLFRNGTLRTERNISNTRQIHDSLSHAQYNGRYYTLLQFDRTPGITEKQQLEALGIHLFDYVPGKAFLAEMPEDVSISGLKDLSVSGLYNLPARLKISPKLLQTETPIPPGSDALIGVSYFGSMSDTAVRKALEQTGAVIVPTHIRPRRTFFIRAGKSSVARIAALPYISYIGLQSLTDRSLNYNNRAAHGLDALGSSSGRNLQGDGVFVGIGDDSDPYTHIDFTGRQIDRFAYTSGVHGVHTSGTLAGGGIINPRNKGMAPHATIISQFYSDILVNAGTYVNDYNMVLTNNSYTGAAAGCSDEGYYDFSSYYTDGLTLDFPNLLHVFAAGNDGASSCSPYSLPFGTVKSGFQSAKNSLVVGNLDNLANIIQNTSSAGPVSDGRVKPEIVAGGNQILSTWPNNTYWYLSGTSMASPTVTGTSALLVQRYRQLHANTDPPAALLKAILCNTATDLGNPGPDYIYGFGALNARTAVEAIENNSWYSGSLTNAGSNTITLSGIPAGLRQLKILLYWPDYPGALYSASALVNNLDLTVTGSDAVTHRPLILNPSPGHVNDIAVEGSDNTNNIEQVVIDNPPAGSFTISVNGSNIPSGPQPYYIVYQTIRPSVTLQYPFGDETWVPGEQETIRWTALGGEPNTFTLQFSPDNGSTWNTIDNAIPSATRMYSWTVPAAATNLARIRITRNVAGYSDTSHAPFIILGQPVLTATNPCQGYASLIWNTIPSAASYDIMRLSGDSMQKFTGTTDTSILLGSLNRDSSYWFSVRAVNGTAAGRRAVAVNITPSGGACALTALNNDLTVDSLVLPASSGRLNTSTQLGSNTPVRIELKNLGTIPAGSAYTLQYRINGGAVISETGPAVIPAGSTYIYTFTQTADLSAAGSYLLQTWVSYPGDPQSGNDTLSTTLQQLANDPLALNPSFTEGFESAAPASYTTPTLGLTGIDRFDFRASDANGRARTFINTGFARTGSNSAILDQQHYGAATTTDSLIATFNLSAYTPADQIWLNFFYRNQGIDSSFPGNKVWIRGNDLAAWVPVLTLDTDPGNFGTYLSSPNIDVRAILAGAAPAQSISSSFQIKFGEQGHTSANSVTIDANIDDGYSFDDITLTHAVNDASVLSLLAPALTNICNLSNAETISLKVKNFSASTMTNIPVSYSINGVSVTESIPSIPAFDSVTYNFSHTADLSAFQDYTIKAWVSAAGDSYHYNDSLAPISFRTSPLIASYPYLESFESNDGHWFTGGINSSWQWGAPAKTIINRAASGTKCWTTSLAGNYNNNELSYLYSPCFDLSSLSHPILSFSHIFQTEDNCACDYHWVEYSTDDSHWFKLGNPGSGTNWYDNAARVAWQLSDTQWRVSSYELPVIASKLRVRIVMNSDQGTTYEGIGIDDIHISEKVPVYTGANISTGLSQTVSGNAWTNFDIGGQRIVSINPNGQNLGNTEVKVYVNSGPVRNDSVQYYLDRNIVIQPATAPSANVSVRYYFLDSEVQRMKAATGCVGCTSLSDAYETGITQYHTSVPAEEDSLLDNDISGTFHFFLPRQAVSVIPYDNGYYAEYQVSGFSEFWINNGGPAGNLPLPINLLSFTALRTGTSALLQWSTSSQLDASRFVIEKAKDGSTFFDIDSVNAVTGSQSASYHYTDVRPGTGTTWYRLKMIDTDGHFSYSPIRSITDTSAGLSITLYPNPIHTGLLYIGTSAGCRRLRLTDAAGKLILQTSAQGYLNTLPVTGLARGIYFVSIDTDEGSSVQKLFVK